MCTLGGPLPCSLPGGPLPCSLRGGSTSMFTSGGGVHFHVHFWGWGYHVTYPIMHMMLPLCSPDTKWWVWLGASAYIVLPQSIMGRSHGTPPPQRVGQTDKHLWKHYFPALRVRAVMMSMTIHPVGNKNSRNVAYQFRDPVLLHLLFLRILSV